MHIGCYYVGYWKNGRRHGQGKLVYYKGTTYEGAWGYDHFHGPGKYTNEVGKVFEGDWVLGKLNGIKYSYLV